MEEKEMEQIHDEEENLRQNALIKVIGVGGGGCNAVNGMIHDKEDKVEYWVFNTDSQALRNSPCENKFVLGVNVTRGLGAGGLPSKGKEAAEASYDDIKERVKGADMVFIACGEGGGTGTGAAPVVARAAKEEGCLVLGIVTRPFNFEGKTRKTNALMGINELKQYADALIVVSNDKLMFNEGDLSVTNAFANVDHILATSVKTVTDLILLHGIINLDFADVKATLAGKGLALIGIGEASGPNKALEASKNAINSPLLESSIRGSNSMIINFTVGEKTTLNEINDAVEYIIETATGQENSNCNIIFGVQSDPDLDDTLRIAIIATDFDKEISFNDPVKFRSESTEAETAKKAPQEPVKTAVERKKEATQEESVLPNFLKSRIMPHLVKEAKPEEVLQPEKKEAPVEEKTEPEVKEPVQEEKASAERPVPFVAPSIRPIVDDEEDEEPSVITSRPDFH